MSREFFGSDLYDEVRRRSDMDPDSTSREIACQNCGTHFNVHRACDVVRCPGCRVLMHADDLSPYGCHAEDRWPR
jgi:translation initiation factor 2 gamma subunit (eIF-2gamma)